MMQNLVCRLEPFDPIHKGAVLPDGREVIFGRSSDHNVSSIFCSKQQLSLIANYKDKVVKIKLLGRPVSYVDGKLLAAGEPITAVHDSIVELIKGFLKFRIIFSEVLKRANDQGDNKSPLKKTMTSFFWQHFCQGEVLYGCHPKVDHLKNKIGSFDLDGTLIKTKSGNVFPKNSNDWTIWDDSVKPALAELHRNNYQIVIFSNQAALSMPRGKMLLRDFEKKVENIIEALGVPISIYISTSDGYYRKPAPGMWDFFKTRNPSLKVNMMESFYVGDAAGRPADWKPGKKADFAASDRLFALNSQLRYLTPEEFFLKEAPARYTDAKFVSTRYDELRSPEYSFPTDSIEVILMVGSPASGKSHFVQTHLIPKGYHPVSRDNLGNWQKCVASLQRCLDAKQKVVIDNTNPDKESRKRFIEICKQKKVPVRCFVMKTTLERCLHNNKYRQITDTFHQVIKPNLIKNFHLTLEPPTLEEGFSAIVDVPFVPSFTNLQNQKIYNYFLVG